MRAATEAFFIGALGASVFALAIGAPFDALLLGGAAIAGSGIALGRILVARAARFA